MKIIGLTGKAGAGKDTACGYALEWCKEQGINAERFAFADPLKVSAAANFGIPAHAALDFCNWLKQPDTYVTAERLGAAGPGSLPRSCGGDTRLKGRRVSGRTFLQQYGTEAHRDVFGTDFWVSVTEAKIDEAQYERGVEVVFLTDPRFKNEADMIHRRGEEEAEGGEIWEVVRPGLNPVEAHASEAGLPDGTIEFQILNVGDLADLRELVRSVCESNLEGVK